MAAWKTIRITKPCTLRIENNNLIVENAEYRFKLCLEDTDSIIFEGERFMISAKVLSALSRYKVAVLFCDAYYLPCAIMHPYHQSSLATRTLKAQIDCPHTYAQTLWQQIVTEKIALQKEVLQELEKRYNPLETYIEQVTLGDKHGAEAKSARHYWKSMFEDFVREQESFDLRNQMLNYTYALVRSLITRDLSAAGFLPALGIWHDNTYNAFNLSDDLMEPFRPIVDIAVYKLWEHYNDEEQITSEIKKALIAVLDLEYILYEEGVSTLRTVSKRYVQMFKKSVFRKDPFMLTFPKFDTERLYECI